MFSLGQNFFYILSFRSKRIHLFNDFYFRIKSVKSEKEEINEHVKSKNKASKSKESNWQSHSCIDNRSEFVTLKHKVKTSVNRCYWCGLFEREISVLITVWIVRLSTKHSLISIEQHTVSYEHILLLYIKLHSGFSFLNKITFLRGIYYVR